MLTAPVSGGRDGTVGFADSPRQRGQRWLGSKTRLDNPAQGQQYGQKQYVHGGVEGQIPAFLVTDEDEEHAEGERQSPIHVFEYAPIGEQEHDDHVVCPVRPTTLCACHSELMMASSLIHSSNALIDVGM